MNKKMKYKTHSIWAVAVVVALVAGIFWGKGMAAGGSGQFANSGYSSSTRGGFRTGSSGSVFQGQVSAISGSDITLQLQNGNSEVVLYSSSTPITEPTNVSISKVATGSNIRVMGTQNSDGSVTASSIEIGNGSFFGNSPGGGQAPTNASSGQ